LSLRGLRYATNSQQQWLKIIFYFEILRIFQNKKRFLAGAVINKLKKNFQIIFILIGLVSCKKEEINGVWMSYNDRIINYDKGFSGGISGFVIDFDNNKWSHVLSDSSKTIEFNFVKKQIRINPDTTKYYFKNFKNDSIEIELYQNTMSVFHPLTLNYQLDKTKKQITEYLIGNKFKNIKDSTNVIFSRSFYRFDKTKEVRELKGITYKSQVYGYWHVRGIRNNYFLIFTIFETMEHNIYQIKSLNKNGMKLKKIQESDVIYGISELKTCL